MMTPRAAFIVAVARVFCASSEAVDGFIEVNRDPLLVGLEPEEKRAVWEALKGLRGRAM